MIGIRRDDARGEATGENCKARGKRQDERDDVMFCLRHNAVIFGEKVSYLGTLSVTFLPRLVLHDVHNECSKKCWSSRVRWFVGVRASLAVTRWLADGSATKVGELSR